MSNYDVGMTNSSKASLRLPFAHRTKTAHRLTVDSLRVAASFAPSASPLPQVKSEKLPQGRKKGFKKAHFSNVSTCVRSCNASIQVTTATIRLQVRYGQWFNGAEQIVVRRAAGASSLSFEQFGECNRTIAMQLLVSRLTGSI